MSMRLVESCSLPLFIGQPGTANSDTDTSLLLVNQTLLVDTCRLHKFHFAPCSIMFINVITIDPFYLDKVTWVW